MTAFPRYTHIFKQPLKQSSIFDIQQCVVGVLTEVRDLMNSTSQKLESSNGKDRRYADHAKSIEDEITKVKNLELRMAIAAPMKAGKSTIINAIVGQDILPSRNSEMTILPTEIVFSKEINEPTMNIDSRSNLIKVSWRSLKREINKIGLDKARQSIASHPHLQNLLTQVHETSSIPSHSLVSGTEAIQKVLIQINDTVRLCSLLTPSTIESLIDTNLRVQVPFPKVESKLPLNGVGKLVIVDTPGPNKQGDNKFLEDILKRQLEKSSIVLLVLDYTQLDTEASEKVKIEVEKVAAIKKGRESIYVLINKIDQRRGKNSMTKEQVLDYVENKFEISANTDRVFEISASRAAYASNFRHELSQNPDIEPQQMETAKLLAQQAFGDMWEDEFPDADMERMQSVAERIWNKSGFADFLEKAVKALMLQSAPRSLDDALDTSRIIVTNLQNELNVAKDASGKSMEELQLEVDAFGKDLQELQSSQIKVTQRVEQLKKDLKNQLKHSLNSVKDECDEELKYMFYNREQRESAGIKKIRLQISSFFDLLDQYQGTGKIEFSSDVKAKEFIDEVISFVEDIIASRMNDARERSWNQVQSSHNSIESYIKQQTKPIIEKAQKRLNEKFNVSIELPEMFSANDLTNYIEFNLDASQETRQKEYYEDRSFYFLFFFKIPQMVRVTRAENYYTVSIEELSARINQSIQDSIDQISTKVFEYIDKDFQNALDLHFNELNEFLSRYRDILKESMDLTEEKKEALRIAVKEISFTSSNLIYKIDTQKKFVRQFLPNKKQ